MSTIQKRSASRTTFITTIEQYEGNCDNTSSACAQKIDDYIKQVGYSAPDFELDGYTCHKGYCYKDLM